MRKKLRDGAIEPAEIFRLPADVGFGDYVALGERAMAMEAAASRVSRRGYYELSSRLADYCANIVNRTWENLGYDLGELFDRAERELDTFFVENNLVETEGESPERIRTIRRIRSYYILEKIKEYMHIDEHLEVFVPLEQFVEEVGSDNQKQILLEKKSGPVVKKLREFINLSHGARFEYRRDVPNDDNTGLVTEFWVTSLIPEIALKLNVEAEERYGNYNDFLSSKARNKLEQIEGVILRFNKQVVLDQMLVYSDRYKTPYAKLNYRNRKMMSGPNARRMDIFLRSLEAKMMFGNKFRFSPKSITAKFDTGFSEWSDFKRHVLLPGIEEFNRFSEDVKVEYREDKVPGSKRVAAVWFEFVPLHERGEKFQQYPYAAYYLATRIKHFHADLYDLNSPDDKSRATAMRRNSIKEIAELLSEQFAAAEDDKVLRLSSDENKNRTYGEWKKVASEQYKGWMKVSNFLNVHPEVAERHELLFDLERMALMNRDNTLIEPLPGHPVSNPVESLQYLRTIVDAKLKKELS